MSYFEITEKGRNTLIAEALEIAINSLEFDGEYEKAEKMADILKSIKGELNV